MNKHYLHRALFALTLCVSAIGAKAQDKLIFHESFNKNWNFTTSTMFGGTLSAITSQRPAFDDERNWDMDFGHWKEGALHVAWNYVKGPDYSDWVCSGVSCALFNGTIAGHLKPSSEQRYLKTRKFGSDAFNGSTVTVKIKLGKPFRTTNFSGGIISYIAQSPAGLEYSVVGSDEIYAATGHRPTPSVDHMHLGAWRTLFFGSVRRTFTINDCTPETQLLMKGNIWTAIYDIKIYVEAPPTEPIPLDTINGNISANSSGWVQGYVSSIQKDEDKEYTINNVKFYRYSITIRDKFVNPTQTLTIPLYTDLHQKQDTYQPYPGLPKVLNINSAGDLINSKVLVHASFNEKEQGETDSATVYTDKVNDVDKVLIMTPVYSELTDYKVNSEEMLKKLTFDGVGNISGVEYNGPSKNLLYYVNSRSEESVKNLPNVCSGDYNLENEDDNYVTQMPTNLTAKEVNITDASDNKDFWNLYETTVATAPTYDRDINKSGSVKSFFAPFDVTYDKNAFTAYTYNNGIKYGNGTARITMDETTDETLKANTPYMLVPKKSDGTYTVSAANNKLAVSVFPPQRNEWTFTGTFRKLSSTKAAEYGAVVLSGGKLYAIEAGTNSYVPALRGFLQSITGFSVKNQAGAKRQLILTFAAPANDHTTAIDSVPATEQKPLPIYSINGVYMGTDFNALPKGVYIVNNHKIIK